MASTDLANNAVVQHVTTLLDDLIIWRSVGNKIFDSRGTSNIQPHAGAWMPTDRSFDRILFWRTSENNSFQLVEYSLSKNLLHNAVEIHFGGATTVLPNVFVVELPDKEEICLMFATHLGVYRWNLIHPMLASHGQLESSQSILNEINDEFLVGRNSFHRIDLQHYGQVTCAYTTDYLVYALHNEIETIVLRFDNQNQFGSPQQFIFPKRQSSSLFNFLWNSNKSATSNQMAQPLIVGQTTIVNGRMTMTIVLYDNGLLKFLSSQLENVFYEHNLSTDVTFSTSKIATKMFLDYCQYETFSDELITRLFVVLDSTDVLHLLIYEFQFDENQQLRFQLYQNKSYTKNVHIDDHAHLPHGSTLTSMNCTNDRITLHFLTNQNRSILLLVQYELKTNLRDQFVPLPLDKSERSLNDDNLERCLNAPGHFTVDMIKEALWITFNLNFDDFNPSSQSVTQILQQLPTILQNLCNEHCDDEGIPRDDRTKILSQFWQNLYSTLIDLRAQALVLLGCRMFDERQLIVLIHKSAVSFYSTCKAPPTINPRFTRYIRDIETLLKFSDDEIVERLDDAIYNENNATTDQLKIGRIVKYLDPVMNNDQLVETLQSMFEKNETKPIGTSMFSSKVSRRLLTLVFVQLCNERLEQVERLIKIFPLVFRSNETQMRVNSQRLERIQDKVLPYLNELAKIYENFLWFSSRGTEISTNSSDDHEILIENLFQSQNDENQQPKTRLNNQSLIEQIFADSNQRQQTLIDAENWFSTILNTAENLLGLFWPNNDFLLTYLPTRHQWTVLDQYCSKFSSFKHFNGARNFFQSVTFYRSGHNLDIATKCFATSLTELRTDPLLTKLFGQRSSPELFYIEWVREYLKSFSQGQNVALFLHQSLQISHSNEIRALIIKQLFKTSLELKNFDDAFWCIQNIGDFLSQKQFTFDYAVAVCSLNLDQSLYRLQTLLQYQRDRLGRIDFELIAYLERKSVENQPIESKYIMTLYEIYKMFKLPLKMAQIMYHYGSSLHDISEQKKAFQLAFDAIQSIRLNPNDSTDRLFVYPLNNEYNSLAPLNVDQPAAHLVGYEECRQRLAMISAIEILRSNRSSSNLQLTETMHPTQLSGLLMKFHYQNEAQQLLEAFHLEKTSA